MEIITHTSGKAIGQIAVLNTLATMEPGEVWVTHHVHDARVSEDVA